MAPQARSARSSRVTMAADSMAGSSMSSAFWMDRKSRSSLEMKDHNSRPNIKGEKPDLSRYDSIYIGFPIWWGVAPRIINTFIEGNDLSGKDIVIFATSGGSSLSPAVKDLQKRYPELDIKEGKLLNGHVTGDIV